MEMKKNKESIVNETKTHLSKRVTELERKGREDEKKIETLQHRLEQSN